MNAKKNTKLFALTLLTSLLVLAIVFPTIAVNAQAQGTFVIFSAVGGTTDPAAGTYNYPDGQSISITATETDPNYVL